MFELPSLWNLFFSTLVFFVAAWYIHRYLEEQGVPKGMTRTMLVFVIASLLSWGAGAAADWTEQELGGPAPSGQTLSSP